MNKSVYVIWEEVRGEWSRSEVYCLYNGTFEEADAFLEKLKASDDNFGSGRSRFYRTEPTMVRPGAMELEYLVR